MCGCDRGWVCPRHRDDGEWADTGDEFAPDPGFEALERLEPSGVFAKPTEGDV